MNKGALVCLTCLRAFSPYKHQRSMVEDDSDVHVTSRTILQENESHLAHPQVTGFLEALRQDFPERHQEIDQLLKGQHRDGQIFRVLLGQIRDFAHQAYPTGSFVLSRVVLTRSRHQAVQLGLQDRKNRKHRIEYFCKTVTEVEAEHEQLANEVLDILAIPRVQVVQGKSPWEGEILCYSRRENAVELDQLEDFSAHFDAEDLEKLRFSYGQIMATWYWWGKGDSTHNLLFDLASECLVVLDHESQNPPFQWLNHPAYLSQDFIHQVPRLPRRRKQQLIRDLTQLGVLHTGQATRAVLQGFQAGLMKICGQLGKDSNPLAPLIFKKLKIAPASRFHDALVILSQKLPILTTLKPRVVSELKPQRWVIKGWYDQAKRMGTTDGSPMTWGYPWEFTYGMVDQALVDIRTTVPRWGPNHAKQASVLKHQLEGSYQRWKTLLPDPELINMLAQQEIVWKTHTR